MCMNVLPTCMSVGHVHPWYPQRPKMHIRYPENELYRWFWVITCMLGTEPGSSARRSRTFNQWVFIAQATRYMFLISFECIYFWALKCRNIFHKQYCILDSDLNMHFFLNYIRVTLDQLSHSTLQNIGAGKNSYVIRSHP